MKSLHSHKAFVYAILLMWLFASTSKMHGHFCFDGMEPPVSVHFDVISTDAEHQSYGHKDVDTKPGQIEAIKVSSPDLLCLAALLLLVFVLPLIRGHKYRLSNTPFSWLSVTGLRPPLRAPPVYSC